MPKVSGTAALARELVKNVFETNDEIQILKMSQFYSKKMERIKGK